MAEAPETAGGAGRYWIFNTVGCTLVAVLSIVGLLTLGHGEAQEEDTPGELPITTLDLDASGEPLQPEPTPEAENLEVEEEAVPPNLWQLGTVPFVLMLLSIAVLPLIPRTEHWWHVNRHKLFIGLILSGLTLLYYLTCVSPVSALIAIEHAIPGEYVPFMVLLFSLYVISGGINISGDLRPTPLTNTTFLAIGTLIASFVGTTGASMLLIRPVLQTNARRTWRVHTVIFFIFLVSNVGGSLLPIGDPPLFLGYLKGVPFLWTFNLFLEWLVLSSILLVVYFVWDTILYRREDPANVRLGEGPRKPVRVTGLINFPLLAGVVLCVALLDPSKTLPGTDYQPFMFMREGLMLGLAGLSLVVTGSGIRETNRFNYFAIIEVAVIFIGIFITMQVPLEVLKLKGAELGLNEPWHYFWITGILSSFLDNAPTYLVFFQTAEAVTVEAGPGVMMLQGGEFIREDLLVAISLGAVFMGANTYIGNGPNFMVKSIAEQEGVRMPSFFGYMLYSGLILIPAFVLVTVIFL